MSTETTPAPPTELQRARTENGQFDNKLRIEVEDRVLAELEPSDVNARVMSRAQFNQLKKNIGRDGMLSSAPLVYGDRIISGHHRVEAAIAVGLETAACMAIKGEEDAETGALLEVPPERLTALQLAHNSIVGEDDPAILRDMLLSIPPTEQTYAALEMPPVVSLPSLGPALGVEPGVKLTVEFLPSEYESVKDALERAATRNPDEVTIVEPSSGLEDFLDVFFAVKAKYGNTDGHMALPLALSTLASLASKQLDAETDADAATDGGLVPATPATAAD